MVTVTMEQVQSYQRNDTGGEKYYGIYIDNLEDFWTVFITVVSVGVHLY